MQRFRISHHTQREPVFFDCDINGTFVEYSEAQTEIRQAVERERGEIIRDLESMIFSELTEKESWQRHTRNMCINIIKSRGAEKSYGEKEPDKIEKIGFDLEKCGINAEVIYNLGAKINEMIRVLNELIEKIIK